MQCPHCAHPNYILFGKNSMVSTDLFAPMATPKALAELLKALQLVPDLDRPSLLDSRTEYHS